MAVIAGEQGYSEKALLPYRQQDLCLVVERFTV
jgi:hypothetical protein